ncbi:MAG: aminoglycoside 6-N-acetyltransferase [Pseudonocardiales bacterium]|nr:aminoglycoside 6-N-acetyltransferase [Pseudonocardiales bacterium]
MTGVLVLRPMRLADLELLRRWLGYPHFARWFLQDSTVAAELADNRAAIEGGDPTVVLIVQEDGRDVGWCQWYRWWDYPEEASAYGALLGEVGIDYGIGEPDCIGRGLGTALIAELVAVARRAEPGTSILVGPSAANLASCRVLAKNGFIPVGVRDIPGEPNASPLALYRLASDSGSVGDLNGA